VAGDADPVARSGYSSPYGVLARCCYNSGVTCAAVPVCLVCRACLPAPARLLAAGPAAGQGSPSAPVRYQWWPGAQRRASVAQQASSRQRAKAPPPPRCRLLLRRYDDILSRLIWGGPAVARGARFGRGHAGGGVACLCSCAGAQQRRGAHSLAMGLPTVGLRDRGRPPHRGALWPTSSRQGPSLPIPIMGITVCCLCKATTSGMMVSVFRVKMAS
jgi:hypothetical protein